MAKAAKHSKAAGKAHPAPNRNDYATGADYASACKQVNEWRTEYDATGGKSESGNSLPNEKKLTTAEKIDAVGIDDICGRLTAGQSQRVIAESIGVLASSLCEWLAANPERSARAREARIASARHWDDQAEASIIAADELIPGSIAKARELASHYRWRASKYAPKDYGDKLDLTATVTTQSMTDEQLLARAEALKAKLGL